MIHLLTENNDLRHRIFPLGRGIKKHLLRTLKNYNGDKNIEGYKRLNNLLNCNGVSYNEMKRIKNFFDNYNGSDKSIEYILNGGRSMALWVNNTLNNATKSVHDFKQAKKDAGIKNAFIKPHEKDRQRRKNKITNVKIKNNSKNLYNGDNLKYENKNYINVIITEEQLNYVIKEDNFFKDFNSFLTNEEIFNQEDFNIKKAKFYSNNQNIRVFGIEPIKEGSYISPSKKYMLQHANNGHIYSKIINFNEIRWINPNLGIYCKII